MLKCSVFILNALKFITYIYNLCPEIYNPVSVCITIYNFRIFFTSFPGSNSFAYRDHFINLPNYLTVITSNQNKKANF